jgi:flagellar motor component MotA
MMRFIVSLVLLLASIFGAVALEGGNPLQYIAATAFMVELLVPLFALLAVWRLKEIGRALGDAFFKKADAASRTRSARIWEFTEKVCYAAGVIGLLLGLILILGGLTSPAAGLGRSYAAALVAPLYGVMLGVACRVLKARVEQNS